MARIRVEGTDLIVEIEGVDKVWAIKSSLTIPLSHVRGSTPDPGVAQMPKGIRVGGTYWPGGITAGRFIHDGEKTFWDVHDPRNALVIELSDETYARLVIEVEDPRAAAGLIQAAITA